MVSIVIPAFNEEKTIAKCLRALVNQITKEKFEVIVVDNNSQDKTQKIAKSFQKFLNIKIVNEKRQGRGPARALGFDKAGGEIILSTDADTQVPPNWVGKMAQYFRDPKIVAVTGPWNIKSRSKTKNFIANKLLNLPLSFLNGQNFGIRKKIYEKSGGFNKNLKAQEDLDLALRVKKLGKIKYANDITVVTSSRRYKKGILPGWWEYHKTNFYIFLLRDKTKNLEDRR